MQTRDWTTTDYYAELGVEPDASAAVVTAAFRVRAKECHPDRRGDRETREHFERLVAAYEVLGDPVARRRYDELRTERRPRVEPAPNAPPRAALSRTTARWLVATGVALVVAGLIAAVGVASLQRHDAAIRDDSVPVTARIVETGNGPRLAFTVDGRSVSAPPPAASELGDTGTVAIRYDRDEPQRVVLDDDTIARDITLWVVAVKLVVVGAVFVALGLRRLRQVEHLGMRSTGGEPSR